MTAPDSVWDAVTAELRSAGLDDEAARLEAAWHAVFSAPLRAPVLGSMKAGKSSCLNRLLGLPVEASLPIDVLQATARNVRVQPFNETALLLLNDDTGEDQVMVAEDRLRWVAWVRGTEELPEGRSLGLGVDSAWLEELGLELLDTPGINSPTEGLFDVTWASVQGVPLALYAMPAPAICQASDMDFVESVRQHAGAFVFLLTKIDEIGAHSWRDDIVQELTTSLLAELEGRGVSPLAVCPLSIRLEDSEAGGWNRLRDTLREAATAHRAEIVHAALARKTVSRLESEAARQAAEIDILQQRLSLDRETFRSNMAELDARRIEEEEELAASSRRLERRLDALRFETLKGMGRFGETTFQKIVDDIENLTGAEQVGHYAQFKLRSRVDEWRAGVTRSTQLAFDKLEELNAEAVAGVAEIYSQRLQEVFAAEIKVAPPLPEPASPSSNHDEEIADIESRRQALMVELERLKSEAAQAPDLLEIHQALAQADRELAAMRYQPVYHTIKEDDGAARIRGIGKLAGKLGDIATFISPVPTTQLNALKQAQKGAKLVKGIRRLNALVHKKNRLLRKTPGVGRILDKVSFEYWGEQVGGWIGQVLHPDRERRLEDTEVRIEFEKSQRPYRERIIELRHQLVDAEVSQRQSRRAIDDILHDDATLRAEIELLRGTGDPSSEERASRLEALQLLEWKAHVMEHVQDQLLNRGGRGWYAQVRHGFEEVFDEVRERALARFSDDSVRTIRDMEENLRRTEATYDDDRQAVEQRLEDLKRRRSALANAAAQLGTTPT